MRRFGIFCVVACGLLLIGIGSTPSFFRELSVGGGYGSSAQGDDGAGGIWLEDNGDVLMDGDLTVDGDGTVGGTFDITGNATAGGTLGVTGNTTLGGTVTTSGNITVSKAAATTASITLTNSSGSAVIGTNATNTTIGAPGTADILLLQSTGIRPYRTLYPGTGATTIDLGVTTSPWRNLFLSGDATIGGGDISTTSGMLSLTSDQHVGVMLDSDDNGTDGVFFVGSNGDPGSVFSVSEAGSLAMTGSTAFSTIGTFAADDATPSVAGARFFKPAATGHTDAVAVTALDDGVAGQEVIILGVGTNETWTLTDGSTLANMDGDWVSGASTNIHLVFDGTNWFEIARR